MATLNINSSQQDNADEVMALGRMVSFACQRSKGLNLGLSTYFLEMALMSLVNDIGQCETGASSIAPASMLTDISELH